MSIIRQAHNTDDYHSEIIVSKRLACIITAGPQDPRSQSNAPWISDDAFQVPYVCA